MDKIKRIEFAKMPDFNVVTKDKTWQSYGYNNALCYELIELLNKSSKHNALITSKVNYITGNGLKSKNNDPASVNIITRPNVMESGNELIEKLSMDSEVFGGFYLQLVFGKVGGKLTDCYHVPFQDIMPNDDGTKFLYEKNGKKTSFKNGKPYDAFDPLKRKGTSILYVRDYRVGSGILTLPSYYSSLKYIKIDAEIANFNYNNIVSGFAAGTMLVLSNGKPENGEQEREIIDKLKINTSGTDNAGEVIVYFAATEETPPQVIALNGNDLVDRFNQLEQICQENIFIGHKVINPSLFGVKTAGQLGNTQELAISWDLFKQGYIEPKQKQLESTFNLLSRLSGGIGDIYIDGMTPINLDYMDLFDRGLVSKETAQKELGLPIDLQMASQRKYEDIDEYIKFGANEDDFELVHTPPKFIAFDAKQEQRALAIIAANPQIDTPSLINAMEINAKDGSELIKSLIAKKLVNPDSGLQVTPQGELTIETPTKFFVKYRYSGPKDEKNRAFCAKLLSLKKVYSRDEINQLSEILGYNVWMRKGGWYHNPELDVNTPYCRHRWEQVIVKSK